MVIVQPFDDVDEAIDIANTPLCGLTSAILAGDTYRGWGRTGPYSLADFTDLIWVNVRSGQRSRPIG